MFAQIGIRGLNVPYQQILIYFHMLHLYPAILLATEMVYCGEPCSITLELHLVHRFHADLSWR